MPLFSTETYGEFEPHIFREWLLTNGTGAYAGGTILGINTRRYHGLLSATMVPPARRVMCVNRLEESLLLPDGREVELSASYFGDDIQPRGDRLLRRFTFGDICAWEYVAEGIKITKELQLCWGRNVAGVRYIVEPPAGTTVQLKVTPFVSLRSHHAVRHTEPNFEVRDGGIPVVRYNNLLLRMRMDGTQFVPQPDWWYGHSYPLERERGLEDREDLFAPGHFTGDINGLFELTLWFGLDDVSQLDWDQEVLRRREKNRHRPMPTVTQQRLVRAASDFVIRRPLPMGGNGTAIIAGYPWFGDRARETMVSLPGLLLATGRHLEAGQVLAIFANHVSEGMIPNYFEEDTNEPIYETADASLWFIHAVHIYRDITGDHDTYHSIFEPACQQIIEGYRAGTRFNIHVDQDGLVDVGDAFTWMDARNASQTFSPRRGKPVEVQALWFNALKRMGEDDAAEHVRHHFLEQFYLGEGHGLADVVGEGGRDESIRPNQVFAVSLTHSMLEPQQQRAVVNLLQNKLLTPVGLRSLDPHHPNYHPRYRGDQNMRDAAYHNGTIWPWLMGPFLTAYLRANGRTPETTEQARAWLRPLVKQIEKACIGTLGEIFEASPPHRAVGCMAHAPAVAEVLRMAVELEL